MRVVFSNRAYAAVLAETTEKIKTETGGLFLGAVQNDTFYIVETIDPGPKSIFEVAYFEYDQKYTQHLINKIANLYERKLNLIGLWHRHPGSFDQFSSTDDGTNAKYAAMRNEGAISALVNIDPNFRITMYHVAQPCRYSRLLYEVGDQLIPDELLRFKTPDRYFELMNKILYSDASQTGSDGRRRSVSLASFMKFLMPFMPPYECGDYKEDVLDTEAAKEYLIDEIIDDLTFMTDSVGVEAAISVLSGHLTIYQETKSSAPRLDFFVAGSQNKIILSYNESFYQYHRGLLSEAFESAKAAKTQQNAEQAIRNQYSILNSVLNIMKFNRNED